MPEQRFTNYAANDFDEPRAVQRTSRRIPAIDLVLVRAVVARSLRLILRKNFRDLLNRIPIARRRRRTQEFLDSTEVADGLHLPAI